MMRRQDNIVSRLLERKNIALIALVVISIFSLLYMPLRGALTDALYVIAPKMWGIGGATHNMWDSFVTNFRSKEALVVENDALHTDVLRMQAQVLDRNLLEEKVNKLEEALGRAQGDNRVVAYVLAGPGQSPYDTLVVDAGEDNGLALGDKVVYAGSGVIGEVIEVSRATSKVRFYSAPGEEHMVVIGSSAIPAKALGKGMGNFETKVPQGSEVALGDKVRTLQGGLLLGTISSVEKEPSLPFARVLFRLPFNITEIGSVEIIVDKHL